MSAIKSGPHVFTLQPAHLWCRHISSCQVADVGGQHKGSFLLILGLDLDVHPGGAASIRSCSQQHKRSF